MPQLIGNNALDLAILLALTETDGIFDGALLMLFSNDVEPDRDTVRGDLTDATYSGNGDEAITWGVPSISDDGVPEVIGIAGEFRPTAETVQNTIFGAAVLDAADGLLKSCRFDQAVPMMNTRDSLTLTVRLRLQTEGLVVVIS
jgi:hypothetical protein